MPFNCTDVVAVCTKGRNLRKDAFSEWVSRGSKVSSPVKQKAWELNNTSYV